VDRRPGAVQVTDLAGVEVARASVSDRVGLERAFERCDAVAHCAGINREVGTQTYETVHVAGTANVVSAAEAAGVERLALMSFLRARPACGSSYHETKWAAEEIVRASKLHWTILKAGMVYGRGDSFLDHLSRALFTFPIYVGIGRRRIRPLWIDDLVEVLVASVVGGRLNRETVPVLGPTEIAFDDAVRAIARVLNRRVLVVRLPLTFHRALAWVSEQVMKEPLVARAQIRMLEEEIVEPVLAFDQLPQDLQPATPFDERSIRAGLPEPARFGFKDLRFV
jgi:NADH dehydrogenase